MQHFSSSSSIACEQYEASVNLLKDKQAFPQVLRQEQPALVVIKAPDGAATQGEACVTAAGTTKRVTLQAVSPSFSAENGDMAGSSPEDSKPGFWGRIWNFLTCKDFTFLPENLKGKLTPKQIFLVANETCIKLLVAVVFPCKLVGMLFGVVFAVFCQLCTPLDCMDNKTFEEISVFWGNVFTFLAAVPCIIFGTIVGSFFGTIGVIGKSIHEKYSR